MIDCNILAFKGNYYLLPTLAIAQAIILPGEYNVNIHSPFLGFYDWQNLKVPIVTFDLLPVQGKLRQPKIAILHGLPQNGNLSILATLFDGRARRIQLNEENLIWADESQMLATVTIQKENIDVVIVDLQKLSMQANQLAMMSVTQITK
ncbi:hypothetical protein [Candidatus Berkiella aquae]|nr:hypothetical protein [Candidatus Berkiella aquae]MCS5712592.1 DNA repair protein RadA [Candidatus Berkiella aquae]